MWQSITGCRIILIEEPNFTPSAIEKLELIGEGHKTQVSVKGSADAWVDRIPVYITCNEKVTKYCTSAEDAIATRFFIYEKLKSLDKKVFGSKRLNPLVRVFLVGKLNIQLKNTESQDPEDELLFSQVFKKKQPTLALEPVVTVIEADNNSYDSQELIDELNNYHGQASQEVGDEFPSDSLAKAYNEVMEDINMMYNSVGPDEVNKTKTTLPKDHH